MPVRNAIWTVGVSPAALRPAKLPSERVLEDMIVASPAILSDEWMLIGRQESTGTGGIMDLLAIAPDGALVLIELKRDRTPREVVAQALDYASTLENLTSDEVAAIYSRFKPGRELGRDFREYFGQPLDEDEINNSHQIVVVAASLDDSTERIVNYLNARDIAINVLFFQVFELNGEQLLSRAWLIDPGETQVNAVTSGRSRGEREPWNGEFYASFGQGDSRDWEEARQHGFISGGGGSWYSNTLSLLEKGDRVWVKASGYGFVGVGIAEGPRQPASEFEIDGKPALEALTAAGYHGEQADDPEHSEYFVPIQWLQTVSLNEAINDIGLFGNQNTVCKPKTPKWRSTVERLKAAFPAFDQS